MISSFSTCPECGARLRADSDDESTIAWAPPGEAPPGVDEEDPETEFLTSDPDGAPPGDSGLRTTVQDFAITSFSAPPDAEPLMSASSGGSAVLEFKAPPVQTDSSLPLIVTSAAPLVSPSAILALSGGTSLEPIAAAPVADAVVPRPEPAVASSGTGLQSAPTPVWVKYVISYASAVTLACLYLLYLVWKGAPSLDLPDLAPPATKANRVTTLLYVPPNQVIPPAHQMQLGETKRFGSLRVTPLRVERGPLAFQYFDPNVAESRPGSAPVLKLRLRLENASSNQEFIPLDRQLVFTKEPDKARFGGFKANNFLCKVSERNDLDQHVLVYDLAPDSSWIVQGERLDAELKPGEAIETFIPTTEEGWDELSGELVWRVHLRKGYNRESLRGVTTLVEVRFRSSDIVDEGPAA